MIRLHGCWRSTAAWRGRLALAAAITRWLPHWRGDGLAALESMAQRYNARRFGLSLAPFPRLLACETSVSGQTWAATVRPELQFDSP